MCAIVFWKKGQQVDALRENRRSATPMPAAEKQNYLQSIASLHTAITRLDSRQMKLRESAQRVKAALLRNGYRAALLGQPEID